MQNRHQQKPMQNLFFSRRQFIAHAPQALRGGAK
jgi:hypothetical protein